MPTLPVFLVVSQWGRRAGMTLAIVLWENGRRYQIRLCSSTDSNLVFKKIHRVVEFNASEFLEFCNSARLKFREIVHSEWNDLFYCTVFIGTLFTILNKLNEKNIIIIYVVKTKLVQFKIKLLKTIIAMQKS